MITLARQARRCARIVAIAAAALFTVTPASTGASPARARPASPARGLADPRHNRTFSPATEAACAAAPDGSACVRSALDAINRARAAEGVRPMRLPRRFRALTVPQQLLFLSDLERVDRGLAPVLGLAPRLNRDALLGARAGRDPLPFGAFYGDAWSANWEGGYHSTLEADFAWMYDDGLGSFNLDCVPSHQSGCWGHRHDILARFDRPIVMGAAEAHAPYGGLVDMTELFVGGDRATAPGRPDAPAPPLWRSLRHAR